MIDPMIYFYRKFVSQCIIVEQRTRGGGWVKVGKMEQFCGSFGKRGG